MRTRHTGQYVRVTSRQAGNDREPLVVDLTQYEIRTWSFLWDVLEETCGLPPWFGRNLDAWWDAIEGRGISKMLDAYPSLRVVVSGEGLFARGADGRRFVKTTNESHFACAEVVRGVGPFRRSADRFRAIVTSVFRNQRPDR
jgi:hypothetical protein